jgi:NAD(P)-dependent dehydrogenase (short-subunit alcohol dehydrogenase family)
MAQAMRFRGKVVLISGGCSGIGLATAKRVAQEGATVVIADTQDTVDSVAAELAKSGAKTLGIQADVSKEADNVRMVERAVAEYGKIDCFMANAGALRRQR